MPLPFLILGAAAVMGAAGVTKSVKAGFDHSHARSLNDNSNERIESAGIRLDRLRQLCCSSLQHLGEGKLFVLNNSIRLFLDSFEQIKNVDFEESAGIMELNKLHIDRKVFSDLDDMSKFSLSLAKGAVTGAAGGALVAFGAYSAAATFASASTGTAIASLSGIAAKNATLAFFGGGSLATGGLGIAGGTIVLGGIVAGPALLALGIIIGSKAGKSLEDAKANAAKATEICEQLENGAIQCIAIRRRTYMFYNLLARLDAYLMPLIDKMDSIIRNEGTDYSKYSSESKGIIARAASTAVSVKAVLDTPILTGDGNLTEESEATAISLLADVNEKEHFTQ